MVLHAHYSRIVLLVPRVALMEIAESVLPVSNITKGHVRFNCKQKTVEAAEQIIREWTQRDSVGLIHSQLILFTNLPPSV